MSVILLQSLSILETIVAVLAGFLAGLINTVAGNGSAITLPVLEHLLKDAQAANASNRIGVFAAAVIGVATFARHGSLKLKGVAWLVVPAIVGSIAGARAASWLDDTSKDAMKWVILAVMLLMLFLVLFKPEKWIRANSEQNMRHGHWATVVMFFIIGVYGGFIQAGVGILLLAGLVLYSGYNSTEGNAIKVLITLCFTLPALAVFAYQNDLDAQGWTVGSVMAIGQIVGAFVAAHYLVKWAGARIWVRRLLIVMILAGVAKLGYEMIDAETFRPVPAPTSAQVAAIP